MTIKKIASFTLLAAALAFTASAQQNTLIQTTLSAAITPSQTTFAIASATGVNAPTASIPGSLLYVVDWGNYLGETMQVTAISSTNVTVRRGSMSSRATAHASGAMVLVATSPSWFTTADPTGACSTTAGTIANDRLGPFVTPVLNITNGRQWLCSSITGGWVPGWGNTAVPAQPTAAVASAAGQITPSGPLFHITGVAAITGFLIPVGYNGGPVCSIPDGIWTTTTANNIALASTSVVSKALCWQFDKNAAKGFFPSY